jgi:probable rRNA maturation factor
MSNIFLDFENASGREAPSEEHFQQWIQSALPEALAETELSIRLVDEQAITELNHQYRGKNKATNVLSFPADIPPELELNLLGDIAICAPVIEREAQEQGKTLEAHYCHMSVHGALHLVGYDHIDEQEAEEMEALEKTILLKLGFDDPYKQV